MAKVVISGYYGFGNMGDEAILAGLAEGFRRLAPSAQLTVLSKHPARTEAEHGLRAAPRDFLRAVRHARQCDLLLSGGGGLLQDATSWRSPLYYLGIIQAAAGAGVPVACVGQGIGPLGRRSIRALTRRALAGAEVVTVRDHASAEVLRELGLDREVVVTADLAFLLPTPTEAEVAAAWQKAELGEGSRGGLVVALRRPTGSAGSDLPRRLGRAIAAACDEVGMPATLFPMHHGVDLPFAEEVAGAIARSPAIVRQALSARQSLALFAGFRLAVAMRLHALVFACICGIPPVAVSYDPKIDGLMAELGLRAATSSRGFEEEALIHGISDTWRRREEVAGSVQARLARLREAAALNLELVLPLLEARP